MGHDAPVNPPGSEIEDLDRQYRALLAAVHAGLDGR